MRVEIVIMYDSSNDFRSVLIFFVKSGKNIIGMIIESIIGSTEIFNLAPILELSYSLRKYSMRICNADILELSRN
jgi:hypothetical protein